jgi:hypothetical protein
MVEHMSQTSTAAPLVDVPALLLRFTVQGVALGVAGALLVGVFAAGPIVGTAIGAAVAAVGATLGGPAGFAAGLGAIAARRLFRRPIVTGLGGAIGSLAVLLPVVTLVRTGVDVLGAAVLLVAAIGAAVASPLTLRALERRSPTTHDSMGSWLLTAALVVGGIVSTLLFTLIARLPSVNDACREFGGGEARETMLPPQITCPNGGDTVELISRGWHVFIAAAAFVAVALAAAAIVRLIRHGVVDLITVFLPVGLGGLLLVIGITASAALASPPMALAETAPPRPIALAPQPDPGGEEPVPLNPTAGLPDPPAVSIAFTKETLIAAMQQLADESFATAGLIDDPDIAAGIQAYPVQTEPCATNGVRVTVDIWFATADNAGGLERITQYWDSLGYNTLTETGHVAAAGREPLPAERLDLEQTWDEDDLRLQLTSLCVE